MATQEEIQAVIDDRYQTLEILATRSANGQDTLMRGRMPLAEATRREIEWLYTVEPDGPETVNDLIWRGRPQPGRAQTQATGMSFWQKISGFLRRNRVGAETTISERSTRKVVTPPYAVGGVIGYAPQRRSGRRGGASRQS